MSNIRSTIEQSLSEQGVAEYQRYAEPVIEALEERESDIIDGLRTYAEGMGLSSSDVDRVLINVGLVEPEPVNTESDPTEQSGLETLVASLAQQVQSVVAQIADLKSAAARHGVHV